MTDHEGSDEGGCEEGAVAVHGDYVTHFLCVCGDKRDRHIVGSADVVDEDAYIVQATDCGCELFGGFRGGARAEVEGEGFDCDFGVGGADLLRESVEFGLRP